MYMRVSMFKCKTSILLIHHVSLRGQIQVSRLWHKRKVERGLGGSSRVSCNPIQPSTWGVGVLSERYLAKMEGRKDKG